MTRLLSELQAYVQTRSAESCLQFHVYDLLPVGDAPHLRDVIDGLRKEVGRLENSGFDVRYLFLIGGGDDVPMAEYEFLHWRMGANWLGQPEAQRDPDSSIATDHCYATLSCQKLAFVRDLANINDPEGATVSDVRPGRYLVGRLPFGQDTSPQHLINYMRRAAKPHTLQAPRSMRSMAVSAEFWQNPSTKIFSVLESSAASFHTSPSLTFEDFSKICAQDSPDLLFFNVHGSSKVKESYYTGQDARGNQRDRNGPYAPVDPGSMASISSDHLTVSEACYGARFYHPGTREPYEHSQSIMLSAVYSKCLGFLGASRVAYGAVFRGLGHADFIARGFLQSVGRNGHWAHMRCSLGAAAAQARFAIPPSENAAEEVLRLKNALIFNLYGDPTLFHNPNHPLPLQSGYPSSEESGGKARAKTAGHRKSEGVLISDLSSSVSNLHESLRRETSRTIELVSRELRHETLQHINNLIYRQHPNLEAVEPLQACFRNQSGDAHLLSYRKDGPGAVSEILVVTDHEGNIVNTYSRK